MEGVVWKTSASGSRWQGLFMCEASAGCTAAAQKVWAVRLTGWQFGSCALRCSAEAWAV
jgi:hypothetical protein